MSTELEELQSVEPFTHGMFDMPCLEGSPESLKCYYQLVEAGVPCLRADMIIELLLQPGVTLHDTTRYLIDVSPNKERSIPTRRRSSRRKSSGTKAF